MSLEDNEALIRRWIEARNSSDLEAALACWAIETHEWLTPAFNRFSAAFPDIHLTIDDLIAQGDRVVVRWTLTGTHRGVWRGIPATGNTVKWNATDIYTVTKGKIAALVRAADNLAWLKQLGVRAMWQDKVIE
jgi:steroid delta-isomerase-like uncharacterized protein